MPETLSTGRILTNEYKAYLKTLMELDMLFFAAFMFKEVRGDKFLKYEYLYTIKDELMDIHDYKTKMLTINIPPRFGKTMMIVIFIAWCLAKNPKARFLYITGGDALAVQTSKEIRELVDSEIFREFFNVRLKKDSRSVGVWHTEQGGGLKVASIKGVITGFGAGVMKSEIEFEKDSMGQFIMDNKGNKKTIYDGGVFLDDINKILDTLSKNKNNSIVNDLVFNTVLSRINSPWTNFVNVQQRAGEEDATEAIDEHFKELGTINSGCIKQEYKHLIMPVINEQGVLLCEDKINKNTAENLQKGYRTAHIYDTQYLQKPISKEGYWFPADKLNFFSLETFGESVNTIKLSCIDGADGGTDHYAGVHIKKVGELVYLMDVDYLQGLNIGKGLNSSKVKIIENKSTHCRAEINKEGSLLIDELERDLEGVRIDPLHNSVNKLLRIDIQRKYILEYFRFRDDYEEGSEYDLFMKHVFRFNETSEHDDAEDVLASMAAYIREDFMREPSNVDYNSFR